ncbi:MAG: signal recognition particle protein [Chloroflexota bacterium]|nr:signal recognition particle protein [Chloroflexota bacterium]MDE2840051.1 signal recognition particle protein [Chloroflexota bacterium]MDE2930852.1 signal recognition particle protein [Chloroflexota bacterium]
MFETLSDRLQGVFQRLRGRGKLTEADVDAALREVRLALLEADVNFRVVRNFLKALRERAVGAEVMESLTPGQQVIKIVHEELISLLGEPVPLTLTGSPPHVIMLVGLQGSGKTTAAGKLALALRKQGQRCLLAAADIYRPAAVDQLETIGKQIDVPVHAMGTSQPPTTIAKTAIERAQKERLGTVIVDTAGRLQIDAEMMAEIREIAAAVSPQEVLLVADAMTGQEAVNVAQAFHEQVPLTGLILTKTDGDARGGAALSVRSVTGIPIRFLGSGEKIDPLDPFYPDRLASRILGMGDVLSLIERAEETIDAEQAAVLEKKIRTDSFTLEDFVDQLQQIKKMGSLGQVLEMVPGMSQYMRNPAMSAAMDERQFARVEAIIYSMTLAERRNPAIIDGSRRRRIAAGSGTTPAEVNQLLGSFRQMQTLMKSLASGKIPRNLMRLFQ